MNSDTDLVTCYCGNPEPDWPKCTRAERDECEKEIVAQLEARGLVRLEGGGWANIGKNQHDSQRNEKSTTEIRKTRI